MDEGFYFEKLIREKREALGFSYDEVAEKAEVSLSAYWDIEHAAGEVYTVVPLADLRRILKILDIKLCEITADLVRKSDQSHLKIENIESNDRNKIVEKYRISRGLSQSELGDIIGFYLEVVIEIEQDPNFLERWSLELIHKLAAALRCPIDLLLGCAKRRCEPTDNARKSDGVSASN